MHIGEPGTEVEPQLETFELELYGPAMLQAASVSRHLFAIGAISFAPNQKNVI
jgi:hypothetical protein